MTQRFTPFQVNDFKVYGFQNPKLLLHVYERCKWHSSSAIFVTFELNARKLS